MQALHASFARAAEALWPVLDELMPGLSIEVVAQADSTNTQLLQRARGGDDSPTVMVALEQTAGRGRQGRRWLAAPGESLTFSLAVPWQANTSDAASALSGLSLAVGVALAEAIDPAVQIKWPNDLWLGRRKLGGILIEVAPVASSATQRVVVIGVGLNIGGALPAIDSTVAGAAGPAPAALASINEVDTLATAAMVFERVVPALVRAWRLFQQSGWQAFATRFAQRDALLEQAVQLWQGGVVTAAGLAQGVDSTGRLLVHTAHDQQAWSSGEVSVRLADLAQPGLPPLTTP
jgi:BirA family biotin operon repressor/biotin-[acetyl-CoA-carboxylase] ligase